MIIKIVRAYVNIQVFHEHPKSFAFNCTECYTSVIKSWSMSRLFNHNILSFQWGQL